MAPLSGILLFTIFAIVSSKSIGVNDLTLYEPEQIHLSYGCMLDVFNLKINLSTLSLSFQWIRHL